MFHLEEVSGELPVRTSHAKAPGQEREWLERLQQHEASIGILKVFCDLDTREQEEQSLLW